MTCLPDPRAGLLTILRDFGPQPAEDIAALADILGAPEPVVAGLVDELAEAGEIERFAGALRLRGVAA